MNKGRGVGFGIFLLTLGIVWALSNVGIVGWSIFNSLYVLWPLILVAVGIGIIFHKNWIVRLVTWIILLAVLIGHSYYFGDRTMNNNVNSTSESDINIEKPEGLQNAKLELSLGVCSINVDSGATQLVEAKVNDKNVKYDSSFSSDNSSGSIKFSNIQKNNLHLKDKSTNTFKLNENAAWEISVNTGASDCNLDLSKLKVDKFDYDGGASRLNVTFGDKNTYTKVKIDTGVSQVDIQIPESAGVMVRTDKGLSNTDFNGSGWVKKGSQYETDNYEQASCKIEIDADIGVSNFNVDRIK